MKIYHSVDVKIKAVLKSCKEGILAKDVALELGIHTYSLYRWKKELRDAGLLNKMPKDEPNESDLFKEQKLYALEKENKRLKMEVVLLKKLKELGDAKKKKPSK